MFGVKGGYITVDRGEGGSAGRLVGWLLPSLFLSLVCPIPLSLPPAPAVRQKELETLCLSESVV